MSHNFKIKCAPPPPHLALRTMFTVRQEETNYFECPQRFHRYDYNSWGLSVSTRTIFLLIREHSPFCTEASLGSSGSLDCEFLELAHCRHLFMGRARPCRVIHVRVAVVVVIVEDPYPTLTWDPSTSHLTLDPQYVVSYDVLMITYDIDHALGLYVLR